MRSSDGGFRQFEWPHDSQSTLLVDVQIHVQSPSTTLSIAHWAIFPCSRDREPMAFWCLHEMAYHINLANRTWLAVIWVVDRIISTISIS